MHYPMENAYSISILVLLETDIETGMWGSLIELQQTAPVNLKSNAQ